MHRGLHVSRGAGCCRQHPRAAAACDLGRLAASANAMRPHAVHARRAPKSGVAAREPELFGLTASPGPPAMLAVPLVPDIWDMGKVAMEAGRADERPVAALSHHRLPAICRKRQRRQGALTPTAQPAREGGSSLTAHSGPHTGTGTRVPATSRHGQTCSYCLACSHEGPAPCRRLPRARAGHTSGDHSMRVMCLCRHSSTRTLMLPTPIVTPSVPTGPSAKAPAHASSSAARASTQAGTAGCARHIAWEGTHSQGCGAWWCSWVVASARHCPLRTADRACEA